MRKTSRNKGLSRPKKETMPDTGLAPAGGFPIVGIGASAGGLAAFEAFFSAMPADKDPGMAFVLVQHLDPDHKSLLTELVRRYTRMDVAEVTDGMVVSANHAYIIPPNHDMAFLDGSLHLLEPSAPRGQRLPIDYFFRSLAEDQRERAIGIILSGTGSDGTLGARAIKGAGGMVMAQDPGSTEFDGMPRSVMAAGLADYVLSPAEMPDQLATYLSHAFGKPHYDGSSQQAGYENALKSIFVLLRARTGHDFSQYKRNTITRRVERRMAVHQVEQIGGYVRYLQQNPAEVEALFRDLLIGVTSFFRDPEAFSGLEKQVIPQLLSGKKEGGAIRVWVVGCSSGEEAYSIAIMIQEQMDAAKMNSKVQIFATDIDGLAIENARAGVYPASIVSDITPERLSRFFALEPDGSSYRIRKDIRDMLVFSEQDVVKDPPFSRIDMISCRNLMIYMDAGLQKKLIPLFHYALNPGGFLFLGTSETTGEFADLFAPLDRKSKLYRRSMSQSAASKSPEMVNTGGGASILQKEKPRDKTRNQLRDLAEHGLLQQYAAVGILVNERAEIVYIHGHSGRYLELPPGEAGLNILKTAREGLKRELTGALHKAAAMKKAVYLKGLRVKSNGSSTYVNLTVRPVTAVRETYASEAPEDPSLFLVILEEAPASLKERPSKKSASIKGRKIPDRAAELKKELLAKEEYLKTVLEDVESSSEELKSSNEEMQSINEELQSTNEELETSKEELQSVNEELSTVNAELQQKVADLSYANNDMNNLLAGTGIGTIFVDQQLRIRRFTPAVTRAINLIPTDVGRPVSHIVTNLSGYGRLVEDIQSVLDTLVQQELEVQARAGEWYLLRIRPYRTLENVIEGAVIIFFDITDLKKARDAMRETDALRRLAVLVKDANDAITVRDLEGRFLAWNPKAEQVYGWTEAEALKMNVRDLVPEELLEEEEDIVKNIRRNAVIKPFNTRRKTKDGRVIDVLLTATALVNMKGVVYAISATEKKTGE